MNKVFEFPGFVDVHVHFRDPGATDSENTSTGLKSAEAAGFAAVVTMPNTTPACDSPAAIERQLAASAFSPVKIFASACITKNRAGREVADIEALAEAGAAFFTDDGSYVEDDKVMEEAMRRVAALGMVVSDHALTRGGSEADAVRRDIELCRVTGCRLHIQHISTAEGVMLVRDARREGLPVTAEATPHHLLFCRDDIPQRDTNYKMAPPLAGREDRAELRRAVKDGIMMFATDHAPHHVSLKNRPWNEAANGIIGIEAAIPVTWAVMVEEEGMGIEEWAQAWWKLPREIMRGASSIVNPTRIEVGGKKRLDIDKFKSLSRNSPYDGMEFSCWPIPTGRKEP